MTPVPIPAPLTDDLITTWVFRPGGMAHYVESVAADSVITSCGKRMYRTIPSDSGELTDAAQAVTTPCEVCAGKHEPLVA